MGSDVLQFLTCPSLHNPVSSPLLPRFPLNNSTRCSSTSSGCRGHSNSRRRKDYQGFSWDEEIRANDKGEDFGFGKRIWWSDEYDIEDEEEAGIDGFGTIDASIGFAWVIKLPFPKPSQVHSRHPLQNLKTGMTMATRRRFGRIFLLESVHRHLHHCFLSVSAADVTRSNKLLTLWHNKMGHPHSSRLHHMLKSCLPAAHHIHSSLVLACTNCVGSKSHKLPFPSSSFAYEDPFDLVYSDV